MGGATTLFSTTGGGGTFFSSTGAGGGFYAVIGPVVLSFGVFPEPALLFFFCNASIAD
jgi:hypothetical protein